MSDNEKRTPIATVKDCTGLELQVGIKVAWGVGGRYNYGLALGEVESIEQVDYEAKHYDYAERKYITAPAIKFEVKVKSLQSGRKGRVFTKHREEDALELVAITNQWFEGNRG
ncbi:hypothetical protein [Mesorhizobium sp. B2-8-3]|uniref:hypothetical protein n=1 Tax=Mesorhizobium sp. B2-8-3 TaxID=2589905 RepID=UPI00112A8E3D|nr:hypothetical protein [Mesorhizobium sp. B2-8-3]TPJ33687.1 hypothetical protein FJ418_13745 [Mesorhizobium sp. B2-8-3]